MIKIWKYTENLFQSEYYPVIRNVCTWILRCVDKYACLFGIVAKKNNMCDFLFILDNICFSKWALVWKKKSDLREACSWVVRAAWLWCRKSPEGCEFEAGLCHPTTENSVNPAVNGYIFRIREGSGSKRRGMGSAFHFSCSQDIVGL